MAKILVIEDERPVRENLVELLEAEDYETYSTENGLLGTVWAYNHFPDLIICDVMMPEIDGYEVLSGLRANSVTASIPLIFLTAKADKTDIRRGMNLGADDYLTKPFSRKEVLEAISSRLSKQKILTEYYHQERQNVEKLQQELLQMKHSIAEKDRLLKNLQEDLSQAVPQLKIALSILKKSNLKQQRKNTLKMVQRLCMEELNLLQEIPHFKDLFPAEDAELIQKIIDYTP
ncbi:MAG: response regulator [Prochloraceae cyanobacterium]|nr:response regulator [Prochloraceae cyanobacterium]